MLKKKFNSTKNTVESFGNVVPFANCGCDPVCNCSCQSDWKKSSSRKISTKNGDYAARAKLQKW